MSHEMLTYSEGEDRFDAVVVRPAGDVQRPAVLVCHAWGGRSEFEQQRAAALAELGYVGVAIDLYGVGKRGHDKATSQALMGEAIADPPRLRRRLRAACEAVCALDGVDAARVGMIGYCFGGMCSILAARMGLPLRGVVSFHGLLDIGEPLEGPVVAQLMVQHGMADPMVPPDKLGSFAAEMLRIEADWRLHAYPGVVHAFTNPAAADPEFGTVYDADADRRSWAEMRDFWVELFGESSAADTLVRDE